ncbi:MULTISPECIES: phosphoribosylglycinamide formyltransferase [Lelliottia]|jgi:phosphoribosylglycinamide formyltransferase-1|uniref:Phosphoribosylglycinamide formyltransferase n=1 Tax=Lelliottia aquatilis TaxID=2080838 RepID=A0ABX4ZZN0_9ENTR|nr:MULTISPECIES: phosphoribosylglycinamide formyltransferase [Lelliottia]NTZ45362.1 phosphoribosylglycinamide formyltransferase [Lelliottia aquatilis]POZ15826.1 phosphoribosylglycinamide formyltransferase [Lelliottia aquatilis]POZ19063.1 phosphoribosylglycinamide formyltransferase [Lelliottia sp. 7254-16]POZ21927.1 phosphoribosylglycinamide formyltransferase [Lelliottia aquatilis]POZ24541.1 phosphoribosylglycinamide formyltransferase [Lelliottia aquatilis]
MKNIVVLISGNGSNLQAIIDACKQKQINGTIRAVFSNKADAFGLERARDAHIPAHALEASQFASREAFDRELVQEIDAYAPDVVVLAGYMRILSPAFVSHYSGRLLNIHPSLLPKYPGLHTHRQVLENGDEEHGTSVHFVTDELDGGPVILQAKIPVFDGDDEDDITERVQSQEHAIYPLVVSWFVDGRLEMRDNAAWLDGVKLPAQGHAADE